MTNYLFSIGDSSELYDLEENREKAIYQAIKSNDVELVKQLLIVLLPDIHFEKISLEHLKELKTSLLKSYEELKPKLSKDMESHLDNELRFYGFLCSNFNLLATKPIDIKAIIGLFKAQSDVNYQIDKLLLSLIAESVRKEELLEKINNMIELLEKHEKFAELEYKVGRLKSELASGKSKYSAEVIKASIEERENEMKEIEEKYIKPIDLIVERRKLLEQ
jgi:hypothetical protein